MKHFKFPLLNVRCLNVNGMLRIIAIFHQYFRELYWDTAKVFVMQDLAN